MDRKTRIALLFGGKSAEHDVSLLSAANVFGAIDPAHYEVVLIGVARNGDWRLCGLVDGEFPKFVPERGARVALAPGGAGRLIVTPEDAELIADPPPAIDVVFPVLHGPFGEDGTVQGAAELAGVAYVGSGVLGSAAAMDKEIAKRLMRDHGLPIAKFISVSRGAAPSFESVIATLGRPVFVKPARMGSSVGVSRASTPAEFDAAVAEAFRHDRKILVEEYVRGREVECGVLEEAEGALFVSEVGEIVPSNRHAFYSYEAKYLDADGADVKVPADLSPKTRDEVKRLSAEAFRALDCEGLARVDFFLKEDGRLLLNEVNTLPGFTNISMYPKALAASGIGYKDLVDRLIRHAIARAGR
jgi:D-alanine-D-alanine ligase